MNLKICSVCDLSFDFDTAKFKDIWENLICNTCFDKGLKPVGYHAYWNCTCDWCKANKIKCKVCGCNYDKDKQCERDHKLLLKVVG